MSRKANFRQKRLILRHEEGVEGLTSSRTSLIVLWKTRARSDSRAKGELSVSGVQPQQANSQYNCPVPSEGSYEKDYTHQLRPERDIIVERVLLASGPTVAYHWKAIEQTLPRKCAGGKMNAKLTGETKWPSSYSVFTSACIKAQYLRASL